MNSLHPRHRIDIGPEELLFALGQCARRVDPGPAARRVEALVEHENPWIAGLSVRSCFDLLLTALDLEPGAEVLLSALTIPDMARLVTAHGLVAVPVDIDAQSLSPTRESLDAAWSPRARVLVVAQLFGAQADLDASVRFCAERGLLLVNDNAQGYTGPESLRDPTGDVAFYSFGSIKTATCLGGALARVNDPALCDRMRSAHAGWAVQPTEVYARKLAQYTALLVPREPAAYAAFERLCERLGSGLDGVVMSMTRGFPSDNVSELLTRLRHRPSGALLALMARRFQTFDGARVARRALAGEAAVARLEPSVEVLGSRQKRRTHWLFAAMFDGPESYVRPVRARGFDCARGTTSIAALEAPRQRPEAHPAQAHRIMQRLLFVPMYPEMPERDRDRLAEVLCALQIARSGGP